VKLPTFQKKHYEKLYTVSQIMCMLEGGHVKDIVDKK